MGNIIVGVARGGGGTSPGPPFGKGANVRENSPKYQRPEFLPIACVAFLQSLKFGSWQQT